MQTFYGPAPLSDFRRRQLRERLQAACPSLCDLQVAAVYFLDVRGALDDPGRARLRALLSLDADGADNIAVACTATPAPGVSIYVIPRTGTLSPWSSKATDIFHVCGLTQVRRIERGFCHRIRTRREPSAAERDACAHLLHDRMTEQACCSPPSASRLFARRDGRPLREIELVGDARAKLQAVNRDWGLALSDDEIAYLLDYYSRRRHPPTDAELMTFAQANSEHCRHKLFNAEWTLDGRRCPRTLFEMIRHTHTCSPRDVLSAYADNAAVVAGARARRLVVDANTRRYRCSEEEQPFLIKVETHNHPTAIAPFAGAATGAGGEIRDEAATGRGGRPAAGLSGFSTSNLRIPGFTQAWEGAAKRPSRVASPLQIMLEGPIGCARFNNEFGRPNLCGYFRTFEREQGGLSWGYHKPIMVAGGVGSMRRGHVAKRAFPADTPLVVFGGPAMLIGLGGGSASSVGGGASAEELDFASVQRDNAEIQRRCQEVIEQCAARGDDNPILAIHDVGAGGLANALPELVHGAGLGGRFELREVPCADGGLSPLEIWCNEAQERYVAAVAADKLDEFLGFCRRERCPVAVVGRATAAPELVVSDRRLGRAALQMPTSVLLGDPPRVSRSVTTPRAAMPDERAAHTRDVDLTDAAERVLKMPAVASKSFLITIGDRSVTGLVARDQMVGPWQVPVADAAVTLADYSGYAGCAMALGERAPVALADAPASGRLAVTEALLNVLSAGVDAPGDVRLSANWMAAADDDAQAAALFNTVRAVAEELCPALGIAIPVGKDSLSMQMAWRADGRCERVVSPLSLVVSAFAAVADVRNALTPQPDLRTPGARLWLLDLSGARNRLGGSCLMQAYGRGGGAPADLDDPRKIIGLFGLLRELRARGWLLAYHDRSDGGLFACLAEMAFAGRCGVRCEYQGAAEELPAFLFSEEPGVVIQAPPQATPALPALARRHGLDGACRDLGCCMPEQQFVIAARGRSQAWPVMRLKRWWWETSYRMQALRDHPRCAAQERAKVCDENDPGLSASPTFDFSDAAAPPPRARTAKPPKVAILREQGINGHIEMAAAFLRAGFDARDVHMSDLIEGREDLRTFHGLAAAGGFSYGDVLGAGAGWAQSILLHRRVRDVFAAFLAREDTFTLGVCNGCQMLSRIAAMIPGAAHWPRFEGNASEQFEARLVMVRVLPSASILLSGMEGSVLPVVVAHGEGRAAFASEDALRRVQPHACLQYVDGNHRATERYPENPNASTRGYTGFCSEDGRVTIMMPHPERVFRSCQHSWHPPEWGEAGPWSRLFENARRWLAT